MYKKIKKNLDFLFAIIFLVVLSPVFLLTSILVVVDSGFPFMFAQKRVGLNGNVFKLYKFRSMKKNADSFEKDFAKSQEIFINIKKDPRITKIGKFIRKYSLDELPQLFNILKGEMSFVGPRPLIEAETNKLPKIALKRLTILPGLTGLAQIEGRKNADILHRCACDIYYSQHSCFSLDLKIIFETFFVIFSFNGAY